LIASSSPALRALILIHRWLGIAFCLLFAMWFATGIVMHFVPFPALTEAERIGGLQSIDRAQIRLGPSEAISASKINDATRVRLLMRADGPVYIVQGASSTAAVRATDLLPANVQTKTSAITIAEAHALRRGIQGAATFAGLDDYDQWTVPNNLDMHRPLYKIAVSDAAGTELYVSSLTGEIVRDTTRAERWWNYAGSVTHWIYATSLRRNWRAWDATVWWLSLAALFTALAGAALGVLRLEFERGRVATPYRAWHAWHHWLGLSCMTFVLTWIFSGWLSMDHGRLFSAYSAGAASGVSTIDGQAWNKTGMVEGIPPDAVEIEWFAFDNKIYRRDRRSLESQQLLLPGAPAQSSEPFLQAQTVTEAISRLVSGCAPAVALGPSDDYPIASSMPNAPVYRTVCATTWLHVDGANGAPLEALDASRRAYRWLYSALHTLDFPALTARPALRTGFVIVLCLFGLAFSMTGVVIGWRRLRRKFAATT